MEFKTVEEVQQHFKDYRYPKKVHEAIEFLLAKINDVQSGQFEGQVLTDFYCDGFFGRRYDLSGCIIIQSGTDFITIRDNDGEESTATFAEGWQRRDMAKLIEEWTK